MPDALNLVFAALADPTRRAVFERLINDGEQNVGELTAPSGVSQPAISKHLKQLRDAGLVTSRKDGRETKFMANATELAPLMRWIAENGEFWLAGIPELKAALDQMER